MLKKYIELIKERISVSEVVGRTVKLKRVGSRLIGKCPFHQEKTPSFSVNDKGRFFYCFGCGKSGDVIDFVSLTKRLDLNEAVEELASSIGIKIDKKNSGTEKFIQVFQFLEELRDWFCNNLNSKVGQEASYYIRNRLDDGVISEFKLGYCPSNLTSFINKTKNFPSTVIKSSGVLDKLGRCYFRDRLVFPINNVQGKVIGFGSRVIKEGILPKYINSCETDFFKKSEVLYNIDKIPKNSEEPIILVEGYMDVISLYQFGYKSVLGILGTSITSHHLKLLNRFKRNLIFCFDGDNAGIKAAGRVVELIMDEFINSLEIKTTFSFLPVGKDPDDLVRSDRAAFQRVLDGARSLSDTIFFLAKYGRQCSSPEDFIELEKILEKYLINVKDYKIRKHFQDFFQQQIFLLKRSLRQRNFISPYRDSEDATRFVDVKKLSSSASTHVDKKVLLLKIVIKFPEVLQSGDREEYFSLLKLSDPQHVKLQSFIVQLINTSGDISGASLKSALLADKETEASYKLLSDLASLPDNIEKAIFLWDKLQKQLWRDELREEYRRVIHSPDLDENKMEEAQRILVKIREAEKE
ncbi:DNA primase [Neorickettsia sp. 179522]|uniref:DNA primase n=1 Tax=Neorickettsia sp. 179522 TaxID=1714371 RepID=UPI0007914FB0|nr:DNA primase [Neorickettsia sp. 179522]KYH12862.1 DNA primase [Neorickettsia sp. 179522]